MEKKRPPILLGKTGEKPPHKVNEWYNPDTEARTEVWFNGKDGYNVYWEGERVATWYIPDVEEWGKTKCNLLAVGAACELGYRLAFGKPFPKEG